jgi:arylsulfatase A-like enzyme
MSSSPPNVIVFFTDQQRWDTSGLHGNPLELMPNFDRIANEGTHFVNAFTCQPVCGPARSSMQTGMYATKTGVTRNGIPLAENANTLARSFASAGYQTGYIGKWHLGGVHVDFTGQQGPVPVNKRGGYKYWLAAEHVEFVSDAYDAVLFDTDNNRVKLPGYRVDATTDAGIRFVDSNRDKPFMLFLSFLEPHHQNTTDSYPAPPGYQERYTGRWLPGDLAALSGTAHQHIGGYFGMVKRLDEAFGRLLDALESLGIADNTIVMFTSDHGNHFKTRNWEYKRSPHESCVRIPAAVCGPGFNGGGHVKQLVSTVDFFPSLLDAANLPIPDSVQGRSVLPLLRSQTDQWPEEVFIQISESQVGRAVRTARWKYSVVAPGKDGYMDAGSDNYIEEFLYDLQADPHELDNLISVDAYIEVRNKMKSRLLSRMEQAGEAIPSIGPAAEADVDQLRQTDMIQRRILDNEVNQ